VIDVDTGHPALRSVDRFTGVKFYQTIRVNPTKSKVLAKMNDQTPLVMERSIGEGKVIAFASRSITFRTICRFTRRGCLL